MRWPVAAVVEAGEHGFEGRPAVVGEWSRDGLILVASERNQQEMVAELVEPHGGGIGIQVVAEKATRWDRQT